MAPDSGSAPNIGFLLRKQSRYLPVTSPIRPDNEENHNTHVTLKTKWNQKGTQVCRTTSTACFCFRTLAPPRSQESVFLRHRSRVVVSCRVICALVVGACSVLQCSLARAGFGQQGALPLSKGRSFSQGPHQPWSLASWRKS